MTEATTVQHEVIVRGTQQEAFAAFVERMDEIKPREHNMLGSAIVATIFEPRVGGHIFDRAEDGSECRWARVLEYEPPDRVVFGWDIGPTWQLESDPANASEVEVRFTPVDEGRTRVALEHRHLDRHGPGWPAVRDGVDDSQGWPLYLTRYANLMEGQPR
ncbi:MAG: SRPBCC family protein [Pedococcus sp.]